MKRSGVQLQVLSLFRDFIKAARTKEPGARDKIVQVAREEFKKNKGIARSDVT